MAKVSSGQQIDFAHDIVPIVQQHCVECHGGEQAEGGFSVNHRALVLDSGTVAPGAAGESRLIELIKSADRSDQMPPEEKDRLTATEIDLLSRWIDQGVAWEPSFSFAERRYEPPLLPRRPKLPPGDKSANPVDRIIDAYLAENDIKAPERLDDAGFVRRLYLDVVGLLPAAVPEVDPESYPDRDKLIDAVLQLDQAYAEHWMTFWNDLLRNAYSGTGYIDGGRVQITAWLYRSLLENKPYDRFVKELIAPTPESEGFIRGIKWRGNVNASQTREIQFSQSVSQTFLGINMKCASCHDSFIDRWTLDEAYGLAAVYSEAPLEIFRCDKPTGKMATAAWIFPELGQIDSTLPQSDRLEQLANLMTHPNNGRLSRTIVNRLWNHFMGRGIVHPVDAMHTEPWNPDLLDFLAVYLVDHDYDLKAVMKLILTSRAYQSRATVIAESTTDFVFSGPLLKRMTAEQFLDSIWTLSDTWPEADPRGLKIDGRQQGGQLAAVLAVEGQQQEWKERRIRAVLTPLDTLQASLGRPSREQIVTTRPDLLTTLEAIYLANGDTIAGFLSRGASQLQDRQFDSNEALVDWLFQRALLRLPTKQEKQVTLEMLGDSRSTQGVEDLLWAVIMLPEYQFIR